MLKEFNLTNLNTSDPILQILGSLGGLNSCSGTKKIKKGFYEIGHFNFDLILKECIKSQYPDIPEISKTFNPYGVCDTPKQFIKKYESKLEKSKRNFVVSFTSIKKVNQSPEGGWRWHKWGPYIGTKKPKHEYLYDEGPDITEVYVYHIYEVI